MNEIFRVLKRGGVFVCVDSLNHNPIYRFNRWIHFLRGNRTQSTLARMPTISLINRYATRFGSAEVYYFGAISWLMPLLVRMSGKGIAARMSDWVDRTIRIRKSAFKFVMIARKKSNEPT
jgi:ubiquinone/menaquinone biosynthesis C-methylase UbiE